MIRRDIINVLLPILIQFLIWCTLYGIPGQLRCRIPYVVASIRNKQLVSFLDRFHSNKTHNPVTVLNVSYVWMIGVVVYGAISESQSSHRCVAICWIENILPQRIISCHLMCSDKHKWTVLYQRSDPDVLTSKDTESCAWKCTWTNSQFLGWRQFRIVNRTPQYYPHTTYTNQYFNSHWLSMLEHSLSVRNTKIK